MSVENSGRHGVFANQYWKQRSTMKNCNVSHSKGSGLVVKGGGLMTIDGDGTTIHHNCTMGCCYYGLHAFDSSSSIHLLYPIERRDLFENDSRDLLDTISMNNFANPDYPAINYGHGGNGTIALVNEEDSAEKQVLWSPTETDSEDEYHFHSMKDWWCHQYNLEE